MRLTFNSCFSKPEFVYNSFNSRNHWLNNQNNNQWMSMIASCTDYSQIVCIELELTDSFSITLHNDIKQIALKLEICTESCQPWKNARTYFSYTTVWLNTPRRYITWNNPMRWTWHKPDTLVAWHVEQRGCLATFDEIRS